MSLYFVDTDDGISFTRDEIGTEFVDAKEAARVTAAFLPEFAKDGVPGSTSWSATIRDSNGTPIFRATLTLRTEWLSGAAPDDSGPHDAPAAE